MVNPSGFWFEAQIKMLWRIKAWMYLRHLRSRLWKSQNTNLTFNRLFFCLNEIKITHSTENHIFYCQSKWILIWSTNKDVMKDQSLNVPATLEIAPRKITKHKSHLQSSIFCLNEIKITFSTDNHIFYCQSKWILIWSSNKNVMKD